MLHIKCSFDLKEEFLLFQNIKTILKHFQHYMLQILSISNTICSKHKALPTLYAPNIKHFQNHMLQQQHSQLPLGMRNNFEDVLSLKM